MNQYNISIIQFLQIRMKVSMKVSCYRDSDILP